MAFTTIGERLCRVRKDKKLTKSQFGKMIGVSGEFVGLLESGGHDMSADLIIQICDLTGASADYLLFGTIDPARDVATNTAVYGLSNEQIQIALDIIKKVAQFVNTEDGNEMLIREVESQLHIV